MHAPGSTWDVWQIGGREGDGQGWAEQPVNPWQSVTRGPEHREAVRGCCFFPLLPATEASILPGEGAKSFLLSHLETPLQVLSSEERARQDTRS